MSVRGTELKADDTIERRREKLARITLDSMVQFVGLLDANGTVLEINQVALDGVGISLSQVEGKPFWDTFWWQVSPEINQELRDAIQRAAKGEFVRWDTEIFGRASGKETIIIDASLAPVTDSCGKVVFITAEGRDITEKKAHEREIARQREELARLDEVKTRFFANVSHEFRTPLTLMLGPLEDALAGADGHLPPQHLDRLQLVHRNAERLLKLVNALLDFSRVEAGRMQARYVPTDLAAMTRDLASNFQSACEKAGVALRVDTAELNRPVHIDQSMWEKIVLNLISNAFKFTFEGSIDVNLRADKDRAVLRVSDTGIGIPPEELPHIFDRFHRVEGSRGRSHEGTGIGLALVKELVGMHGGTVDVSSMREQGSTFVVTIPFGSAHLPRDRIGNHSDPQPTAARARVFVNEATRWLPDPARSPEHPTGQSEHRASTTSAAARLLVVDDNADMRDYLRRLLETRFEVILAEDGEQALLIARGTRPDLILTDVMMPRLDGIGVLKRVRDDASLRDVPVIILSARAGQEAEADGLRWGADDYLVKPFSAWELIARVEAHLRMARIRDEAAAKLREADRRKDEFVATLAHELRNPLAPIRNAAAILQRHSINDPTVQRVAAMIGRQAHDMGRLLDDLLDVSRINQGKISLEGQPVEIHTILNDAVELSRPVVEGREHRLKITLDSADTTVFGDPLRLTQALTNVLNNAAKYTPPRGEIHLGCTADAGMAVMTVRDNGIGIAPHELPKVFDLFVQLNQDNSNAQGGLGIGLTLVRRIVELHGGDVHVSSPGLGQGTTLTLRVPVMDKP